ncbi:MAG: DUF1802 family protein [Leptolyngbyaceae cyanobacterium SM2_5_2]|nr:DUF1802 family protein [Leptolyngbyaceae cyanobacterium SM2_5_2]
MLSWAFKEWDVAITALLRGDTVLLLRKGGIREQQGQFTVAAHQALLLPTFEHQDATVLKPAYQPLIVDPAATNSSDIVCFHGWAEITQVMAVPSAAAAMALLPYLIWNQRFIEERLRWQPDRPLYGLLLRAYRMAIPLTLPRHAGYRGCRSWVELGQMVEGDASTPAMTEAVYQSQVEAILAAVS